MLIMRSREAMSEFSSQENCVKTSKQKVLSVLANIMRIHCMYLTGG